MSSSGPSSSSSSASSSSVLAAFRGLDLLPKVSSDFAVQTKVGGAVSLLALLAAALLFAAELRDFFSVEVAEHMEVDALRGQRMRVNFDVTFFSLPCAAVSVDTQDASGASSHDVLHNVFKRRLLPSGEPAADVEHTGDGTPGARPQGAGTLKTAAELLREKERAMAQGDASRNAEMARARAAAPPGTADCGACYGAGEAGQCCNTCEEVREAYRRRSWSFNMRGVAQCEKEGFYGNLAEQQAAREGCNLFGFLEVPKVPGNFHFAPGHGMQHAYGQVPDLVQLAYSSFNVSHRVNSLSFGEYLPGRAAGVLDARSVVVPEGAGMHQYFVKLVPTVLQKLGEDRARDVHAFQYSVTEHLRRLDPRAQQLEAATGLLPGLFFNYELSPIRVRMQEKRRSLGHFLTNVCAIVGGVFTIGSFADALLGVFAENIGRDARKRAAAGGGLLST